MNYFTEWVLISTVRNFTYFTYFYLYTILTIILDTYIIIYC